METTLNRRKFIKSSAALTSLLPPFNIAGRGIRPDKDFRFHKDGTFTLMQITDIQDNDNPKPRVATFLNMALEQIKPDLIVVTGDNTAACNQKGLFEKSVSPFSDVFKARKTPFAILFGNHDSEKKERDCYTREEQYQLYKQMAGKYFVDYDIPDLNGTGNGVIPLHSANSDTVLFNLFLMDSGAYAKNGYDGVHSDQIQWYESVSGKPPCLWFQHIPVPDIYNTGLLVSVPADTPGCVFHEKGEYAGRSYLLNSKLASGFLKEAPCPTTRAAYTDSEHTYQGRTLYASWLNMGNLKGAYFGHDHVNSFSGIDTNGICLGYTKAATLQSYNDNNPGVRLFKIRANGSYTTRIITESDIQP